ncbi:MAG: chemotaxis protein [Lysobacter sp.]|nr:chemotaxis protein [Lysobacter sp.]
MAERKRAALLARPGPASEQLREALRHAGAEVVLVADPSAIGADEVIAAEPDSVLIALDATVEDMLDRFDAVLGDPSITVIFEEVDVTLAREGWDAARWGRHLHAKIYGHQDVLPPGQSQDSDDDDQHGHPRPGLPVTPQQQHAEAAFGDYLGDFDAHAEGLPTDVVGAQSLGEFDGGDYRSFDIAGDAVVPSTDTAGADLIGLDDFLLDASAHSASDDGDIIVADSVAATDGEWNLPPDAQSVPVNSSVDFDIADLEQRISGFTLADHDSYGHGPARGAVIVLAGLGGPDAVRQLLGGLHKEFSRPVLVSQKLDGGQHEKLVKQMSRATKLPVDLAKTGETAVAGHVYIVSPEISVALEGGKLVFRQHADAASWFSALPASDTAIVMLSGSDMASVDQAMQMAASGALVMGQAPEGCFEPAAPAALAARGGESGLPAELARKLADRWPG